MTWRKTKNYISILLLIGLILLSFIFKDKPLNTIAEISEVPIYSVESEDKILALTFDINWAEKDNIYSILDTLDKYNVKGTFFIIGSWVTYSEDNVEKLKAICERGNEIGNHSYKHLSFSKIDENTIREELGKTDEVIEMYTGIKPKLFRFPSGDYNEKSMNIVVSEGYIPIQWDVDSVDWKELGEDVEYNRVKDNVKPGSIVLFHNNTKYTPNNLCRLLKELGADGYKFVTVSELLLDKNGSVDENGLLHLK